MISAFIKIPLILCVFFIVTTIINIILMILSILQITKAQSIVIIFYGVYSIFITLFNFIVTINFFKHISRRFVAVIVTMNLMTIIPFCVLFIVFNHYPFDFSKSIYIVISILLGYDCIVTVIPAIMAFCFVIYYIICYILFARKTYKAPPKEMTQEPLQFRSLPDEYISQAKMFFSVAPGSTNHFRRRSIHTDVHQLNENNIKAVCCCLTHHDIRRLQLDDYKNVMIENGIDFIHCNIVDFFIPYNMEEFNRRVDEACIFMERGENILVHCNSGKGRTGLFGAAVFAKLYKGQSHTWYIKTMRKHLPGAFDTIFQRIYFKIYLENYVN